MGDWTEAGAPPVAGPRVPSAGRRLASWLVRLYCRHAPIARGQWRLRRTAARWLVAPLDTGPWVRVSGVSDFEWAVLAGARSPEGQTAARFIQLLAPGQVVLDVGANVGYYALTAAARVGPGGRVIAFEPGPAVAARLRENAGLNGLSNLTVVEAAVADRPGVRRFHLGEDSEGSSLYDAVPGTAGEVDVRVVTLDDESVGLGRVDVVKIDAEGAEVGVLRGARRLLTDPHAPAVMLEANPVTLRAAGESLATLRAELESLGYAIELVERIPWRGEVTENWLATQRAEPPTPAS
jgi:FkbM family methyltransferase